MPKDNAAKSEPAIKYEAFLKRRSETTNYRAAEKLQRLDELADLIFTARKNYRRQVKS